MNDPTVHRPVFARMYPRLSRALDRAGGHELRHRLLEGLSGTVLEVGAGDGGNLPHYPPAVTAVVRALEPEPRLRRSLREAGARAAVAVDVVDGVAERLPIDDGAVDAVVCSLVLCSVRDQVAALTEARRVVRAGGQLRFFEHVRGTDPRTVRWQDLADRTVWPHIAGGCHTGRDTVGAIEAAGFTVTRMERFRFPDPGFPRLPHVLGTAVPS
ncbi:class I SAM-dependent methyltransferase [Georgenia alba]|uniref:Class I SAM-dependent methyltransferase n=1 Tax=Georgenia alba TaxID=2233858 RepID=A0ABW2Q948_9MICO